MELPNEQEPSPPSTASSSAATADTPACCLLCQYFLLFFCCIVPFIGGLSLLVGVLAIPAIALACVGVWVLFCVHRAPIPPNESSFASNSLDNAPEKLSREAIQAKLVSISTPQDNKCCEICLVDFMENSNNMVGSPNPKCTHVFHDECILEWLQTKSTCPCCRADYLVVVEVPKDCIEEEGNITTAEEQQDETHNEAIIAQMPSESRNDNEESSC